MLGGFARHVPGREKNVRHNFQGQLRSRGSSEPWPLREDCQEICGLSDYQDPGTYKGRLSQRRCEGQDCLGMEMMEGTWQHNKLEEETL